jgi:tRNA threonylcarbamoyladenosine biosynthesis protein TsaB
MSLMSVLGLDSAGNACSAAVLRGGRIVARRFAPMAHGQAEALMPMIAVVLAEAELSVDALDLIAVTIGPGGFTGLRIGLAAARGLALASGVALLGVTSFAAVAHSVSAAERRGRSLVVALDSKRSELYLQSFAADGRPRGPGSLVPPAAWPGWVPDGDLLLAGDGVQRLAAALAERAPALARGPGMADAAAVALLAAEAWQPGLSPPVPRPLYLRAPDTTLPQLGSAGR